MPGAKWFIGARLNFAENLLRYKNYHMALLNPAEVFKIASVLIPSPRFEVLGPVEIYYGEDLCEINIISLKRTLKNPKN